MDKFLIWVQIVSKGYGQLRKVTTRNEGFDMKKDLFRMEVSILNALTVIGPYIRVYTRKLFFLFLNQKPMLWELYLCNSSFKHPGHMVKLMGKKIFTILQSYCCLYWTT